jgi:hypothetical protein
MRPICLCLLILYASFPLLLACSGKGKPVAWVQKTAPVYPNPRPDDCKMVILKTPPAESHETIAQIWSYGNGQEELPRMQHLIRFEACQLGAHAVILLPAQDVDHVNTFNAYPDWAADMKDKSRQGESTQSRTTKRYNLSQVGYALIYKDDTQKNTDNAQNNAVH